MTQRLFLAALACGGLAAASPANAHHSFAMFEPSKTITLTGVVEKVDWSNPHIWITMDVQTQAGLQKWGMEGGSTNTMIRFGWKRNSLKPGDRITAVIRPMKDGSPAGSIRTITTPSGEVLGRDTEGARPEQVD